jgi:hypothetical protein
MKKKNNKIILLLVLLLAITIGFAALATTLKINGTANIGKNSWNIYWDNIANKKGVTPETDPTITSYNNVAKTLLTWEVYLDTPGDYFEFEVDAVNAGSLDAMITSIESKINNSPIISTVNGQVVVADPSPVPSFIKYTVKYADGEEIELNHLLAKKTNDTPTRETYKIRVEYDRDAVTNSDVNNQQSDTTYTFSFAVTYGQADEHAIPKPEPSPWTLPEGKTADNLEVGDELCIKTECFNFIKYNNDDAVLLAKWNLNVGSRSIGEATNLQHSDARGYKGSSENMYGTVTFTEGRQSYWAPAPDYTLLPKYGSSYPADVYDEDFNGDYSSQNYSIAHYVIEYKNILEEYGATIKVARLLKYSEVTNDLNCSMFCLTSGDTSFVTNTTFWSESASDYETIYTVGEDVLRNQYDYDNYAGVRPVIEVSKSDL